MRELRLRATLRHPAPPMYPTLYHLVLDLFGVNLELLKLVNTFGLMVALGFVAAARTLALELERREALGQFRPQAARPSPAPSPVADALGSGLFAFLLGFKLLPVLLGQVELAGGADAQRYLLSTRGDGWLGVVGGVGWAAFVYYRRRAATLAASEDGAEVDAAASPAGPLQVHARDHTMGITTAAAIGGFLGAKVFHWLESPERIVELFRRPSLDMLFGGLTIYGGLIVGALAVYAYCRRHQLSFAAVCDATAPGLMLAYGVGRVGCQLAGDGDWGIANAQPMPDWLQWLPSWTWAYDYPNNVINAGVPMAAGGYPGYGMHLVPAVYPTPLYEAVIAFVSFAVLWRARLRLQAPLVLFGVYLALNGFARFWIEKIRVNVEYQLWGMHPTQAEVIALLLFVGGLSLIALQVKRARKAGEPLAAPDQVASEAPVNDAT